MKKLLPIDKYHTKNPIANYSLTWGNCFYRNYFMIAIADLDIFTV